MVNIDIEYTGDLHCVAKHGPSGATIATDAPVDNMGKGQAFSPTDLAAAALGTCMMTVMAITALKHPEIDLKGTTVHVEKEMSQDATRRIARLRVIFTFQRNFPPQMRTLLEKAAHTCPIHYSLHPDIDAPVKFVYPA